MCRIRKAMGVTLGAAGLAWLVLTGGAGGVSAADEGIETTSDQEHLEIVVDKGVLTLHAQDVPLTDVLAAIAEHAGFEVSVRGGDVRASGTVYCHKPASTLMCRMIDDT